MLPANERINIFRSSFSRQNGWRDVKDLDKLSFFVDIFTLHVTPEEAKTLNEAFKKFDEAQELIFKIQERQLGHKYDFDGNNYHVETYKRDGVTIDGKI